MASVALTAEFPLRVVIDPAPDLDGQWIAHGPETDLVTQRDSAEHALAMMAGGLQALAADEAIRRRPPVRLRAAPKDVWDLAADAVALDVVARVDRRRRRAPSPGSGPWSLHGLLSRKPPDTRAG